MKPRRKRERKSPTQRKVFRLSLEDDAFLTHLAGHYNASQISVIRGLLDQARVAHPDLASRHELSHPLLDQSTYSHRITIPRALEEALQHRVQSHAQDARGHMRLKPQDIICLYLTRGLLQDAFLPLPSPGGDS